MNGRFSDLVVSLRVNGLHELVWEFCAIGCAFFISELFRVIVFTWGMDWMRLRGNLCVRICIFGL